MYKPIGYGEPNLGKNVDIVGGANFGSEPYLITIGDDTTISFDCAFVTHDAATRVIRHLPGHNKETVIYSPIKVGKKLKTLEFAYHKSPYFDNGIALAERILRYPETNLADFLENSIKEVCAFLNITTPLKRSSELVGNALYKREERIYDACRRMGADTYINAIGGMKLYDTAEFRNHGITLKFLKSGLPEYNQFREPFVERLSILDAIMFNSPEALQKMLDDYTLIDKNDGLDQG